MIWIYVSPWNILKPLWKTLTNFWKTFNVETLWNTLKHFETPWNTLKCLETSWKTLKYFETSCNILKPFWNPLENFRKAFEAIWNTFQPLKCLETSWNTFIYSKTLSIWNRKHTSFLKIHSLEAHLKFFQDSRLKKTLLILFHTKTALDKNFIKVYLNHHHHVILFQTKTALDKNFINI